MWYSVVEVDNSYHHTTFQTVKVENHWYSHDFILTVSNSDQTVVLSHRNRNVDDFFNDFNCFIHFDVDWNVNDSYHSWNVHYLKTVGNFRLSFYKWVDLNLFHDLNFYKVVNEVYVTNFVHSFIVSVNKCKVRRDHV